MTRNLRILLFSALLFVALSCITSCQSESLQYKTYRISDAAENDPGVLNIIKPYSDSVNKGMNDIVGVVDKILEKKSPEGTLGNFMADAFFVMAREKYDYRVDAAFLNYGGIRLKGLGRHHLSGPDFEFTKFSGKKLAKSHSISVSQKTGD